MQDVMNAKYADRDIEYEEEPEYEEV